MKNEETLKSLIKNPLSHKEQMIVNEMIHGKRPIVFGDKEETEILRKLNQYEREKQEIMQDKSKAISLLEDKINDIELEIDSMKNDIYYLEDEMQQYEDILRTLK